MGRDGLFILILVLVVSSLVAASAACETKEPCIATLAQTPSIRASVQFLDVDIIDARNGFSALSIEGMWGSASLHSHMYRETATPQIRGDSFEIVADAYLDGVHTSHPYKRHDAGAAIRIRIQVVPVCGGYEVQVTVVSGGHTRHDKESGPSWPTDWVELGGPLTGSFYSCEDWSEEFRVFSDKATLFVGCGQKPLLADFTLKVWAYDRGSVTGAYKITLTLPQPLCDEWELTD